MKHREREGTETSFRKRIPYIVGPIVKQIARLQVDYTKEF